LSDQNSGSFFDHPVIAENCQIFGHFMSTRESQLQPNWRYFDKAYPGNVGQV
jgi:hypothetical protein